MRTLLRGAAAVAGALHRYSRGVAVGRRYSRRLGRGKTAAAARAQTGRAGWFDTALLILDMVKSVCGPRPRCVATIPDVRRLHDAARAAGAMVWYSLVGSNGMATPADVIDPGFTPRDGEWVRQSGPDKFLGSNLEEKLKARGIRTVVVCGTAFQGVALVLARAWHSAATR